MKRLLLFDIDGTLLRANGTGRIMLGDSMRAVYGTAGPIDTYEFGGRTDRRMVLDLLTADAWETDAIIARLPDLYEEMYRQSIQLFTGGRLSLCPGILDLLAELEQQPDVLLGLLTGNIVGTAPLKLRSAGLQPELFRVGAYGSDGDERNDLLPIVWQRAAELAGQAYDGTNTVIIGDTPADIRCAQQGAARSVAVATGWYTKDHLIQCGPDYIFDDLSDTHLVIDALLT